jgi:type II secretory pathway pseudopilin PulG
MRIQNISKGISILEVVVSSSIILILVTAIAGAWRTYIVISRISSEKTQAALLIEEASDELIFLRDKGWGSNLSGVPDNVTHYIQWSTTTPTLSTTPSIIGNAFIRTLHFSKVYRDGQQNISNTGTDDLRTKKVLITVSTSQTPPEVSAQAEMLIHDIYGN